MKRPSIRTVLGVTAVGIAAAACTPVEENEASGGSDETSADADSSAETTDAGNGSGGGSYAAGEYTATGSYTTPGGEEQIGVTLTLEADGTILELSVQEMGVNPNSKQFQGQFASGIADVAVGENIADLEVDKVAGSSLSSGGFNAAVDAIAEQAQA